MFQQDPTNDGNTADATTRIAHYLLDGIVDTITKFAQSNSESMTNAIAGPAAGLLVIYVLLWGAGIASGQIQEPFGDGIRRIVRMVTIITLGLTVGGYQGVIIDFFLHVPSELASMVVNPTATAGTNNPLTIADLLDNSLAQGIEIGNKAKELGSSLSIGSSIAFHIIAFVIYGAVAYLVAIATGMVFVAFISMSIMLAVGPLFILMALFTATQRFFEAWLSQVITLTILFVLVSASVSLCFTVFDTFVTALPQDSWTDTTINMVKVVVLTIAIVSVLRQSQTMASALGQGVALSSQQFTGKIGGALGAPPSLAKRAAVSAASQMVGRRMAGGGGGGRPGMGLPTPTGQALQLARKTFRG